MTEARVAVSPPRNPTDPPSAEELAAPGIWSACRASSPTVLGPGCDRDQAARISTSFRSGVVNVSPALLGYGLLTEDPLTMVSTDVS